MTVKVKHIAPTYSGGDFDPPGSGFSLGNTNAWKIIKLAGGAGSAFYGGGMTTTQRDALTAVTGMLVYNTTTTQYESYNGSAWVAIGQVAITADIATHAALLTGTHGWLVKTKASDETVNDSTTLQNDDDHVVALAINSIYLIKQVFSITTSAVADFKHAYTIPAGATMHWAAANHEAGAFRNSLVSGESAAYACGGAQEVIVVTGWVKTGATAGNFQFQWAQSTQEVSNTVVKAGAILEVRKVA